MQEVFLRATREGECSGTAQEDSKFGECHFDGAQNLADSTRAFPTEELRSLLRALEEISLLRDDKI